MHTPHDFYFIQEIDRTRRILTVTLPELNVDSKYTVTSSFSSNRVLKKSFLCHSERSEESALAMLAMKTKQIPRPAKGARPRNDNVDEFFSTLLG